MTQKITIGEREYTLKCSALLPRLYRAKFGRDLVVDMQKLRNALTAATKAAEGGTDEEKREAQLTALDLTIFESIAWLMLWHAGEDVPDNPDDWLDSLDGPFSVYEHLPEILGLWAEGQRTTSTPRKK